ncbi:MAG TPA: two-component system response regulator [Desulfobacteraceae bacterium]|nr:two-component system response regulator [Desulfobacteraceae bacterium]
MSNTILAADDSASIRQMIAFTLRRADYDVIEAENGMDALEKLGNADVLMVITDLDMPEMNGIELIKKIRIRAKYKSLPIVMLTTESAATVKQTAKAAGATGWITKPFTPAQLIGVVSKLLGNKT